MTRPFTGRHPAPAPRRLPDDLFDGPIPPMLGVTAQHAFDSADFLFEVKWDGYRAVAFLGGGRTRLQSRNLRDLSPHYPGLSQLHGLWPDRRLILDGEVVALVGGRPDFGRLQRGQGPFTYAAFDLLYVDGTSLLGTPLTERKDVLARLFGQMVSSGGTPPVRPSEAFPGQGINLFEAARRLDLEGIMAKRAGSLYRPGVRSEDWRKIKNTKTLDCVIAGYTRGAGFAHLGSLVLGVHPTPEDTDLVYVGNAGTGFTGQEVQRLLGLMQPLEAGLETPLREVPPPLRRQAVWIRPELVCEIEFTELTADRRLRHPTFRGLRPDKSPEECVLS